MKKAFIPLALATALFTTGCKDSENIIDTPSTPDLTDHEAISFTMADGQGSQTRANTRANTSGFTGTTRIIARFQSDNKATAGGTKYNKTLLQATLPTEDGKDYYKVDYNGNIRYWDDAFGRNAQLSVYAVCIPNKDEVSLLAYDKITGNDTWDAETTPNNTISWAVSQDQSTSGTLEKEDLAYSNNIQKNESRNVDKNYDGTAESVTYGTDGVYRYNFTNKAYPTEGGNSVTHEDGYMLFSLPDGANPDAPGKFDKGHLKFDHSLSRITIELVEGTGFDKTSDSKDNDFKFADGTQIKLLSVPYSGTFDIRDGVWKYATSPATPTTGDISKMEKTVTGTNAAGTYAAQFLPGYKFTKDNSTNIATFRIDNNDYYVTQAMVFEALTKEGSWFATTSTNDADKLAAGFDAASSPTKLIMQQGKNYKLKITVNKTQISAVTATIATWSDISAENQNIDNAHFDVSSFDNGSTKETSGVHLFRITEALDDIWSTGTFADNYPSGKGTAHQGNYKSDEATMNYNSTKSLWEATNWYFNDNKTLYYIRSLNDLACKGTGASATDKANFENTSDNKTYFTIQNGSTFESASNVVSSASAAVKTDYHWGAPFKTGLTQNQFQYYTQAEATSASKVAGYGELLQKGIPATNSTINITELHMMSNIRVVLKTTSDDSKVNLGSTTSGSESYSKVELVYLVDKATVDMGYGLVTPSTDASDLKASQQMDRPYTYYATSPAASTAAVTNAFTWSVVPQELVRTSGTNKKIGIKITTPDNNEYYYIEDLSAIKATAVGNSLNQTAENAIKYWYPNHQYTYTFVLSKKKIEAITCTVAEWATVTAADTPIDLEK